MYRVGSGYSRCEPFQHSNARCTAPDQSKQLSQTSVLRNRDTLIWDSEQGPAKAILSASPAAVTQTVTPG